MNSRPDEVRTSQPDTPLSPPDGIVSVAARTTGRTSSIQRPLIVRTPSARPSCDLKIKKQNGFKMAGKQTNFAGNITNQSLAIVGCSFEEDDDIFLFKI